MPSETETDLAAAVEMLRKQCDENEAYLETLGGVPEDIRKGIAAIRTVLAALPQWQPIESAPRDREFIAYSEDLTGSELPPFVSLCKWHPDAGFCTCELRQPTYWMEYVPPQQKASEQ